MYLLVCILPSIAWWLLNTRTWQSMHIHYRRCKFGCKRSIIRSTLPDEQYTFTAVCQIPLEGFSLKFISGTPSIVATKRCRFACGWSQIKSCLLEEQFTFSAVSGLLLQGVSQKCPIWYSTHIRYLQLHAHLLQMMYVAVQSFDN
jgi:hypothetical protein